MSLQYDSLHDGLEALRRDLEDYSETVQRFVTNTAETFAAAERDRAELRDELHAVANRVENLHGHVLEQSRSLDAYRAEARNG